MKVLVLGGNRFFGKRLVNLLIEQGDQVTVLNRGSRPDTFGDRVRQVLCDRTQAPELERAVGAESWDVIYDQVCYDADTAEQASRIFRGRVGQYVFTSSMSIYDYGSDLKESVFDPTFYHFSSRETYQSDYGEAKRQAEAAFFQAGAFPVVAVRFPVVFGPDDYTGRLVFHLERIAAHRPMYFPNLDARTCFIHADDAAQVLLKLGLSAATGPLNACSPDPIRIREFLTWMEDAIEARAQIVSRPELGETSPVGIPADIFMNTERLQSLGIHLPELGSWLPDLIRASLAE